MFLLNSVFTCDPLVIHYKPVNMPRTTSEPITPTPAEPAVTTKTTKRRRIKRKLPGGIPRPPTGYMLFRKSIIEDVKKSIPEKSSSIGELSKIVSTRWKALDAVAKKPFEDDAAKFKSEYNEKISKLPPPSPEDEYTPAPVKKARKMKDPNKPKGPLNSYMLFNKAMRDVVKKDNPEMKITDLAKLIGEKWNSLSTEDKEPYKTEADRLKADYKTAMESYVPQAVQVTS